MAGSNSKIEGGRFSRMSFSLRSRASGGVEERLVVFSIEGARDLLPDRNDDGGAPCQQLQAAERREEMRSRRRPIPPLRPRRRLRAESQSWGTAGGPKELPHASAQMNRRQPRSLGLRTWSRFGWFHLFNFRPAQIEQRPYDDPNHRLVGADGIFGGICLNLTDKKNIRRAREASLIGIPHRIWSLFVGLRYGRHILRYP
jgi:hypothetical protein